MAGGWNGDNQIECRSRPLQESSNRIDYLWNSGKIVPILQTKQQFAKFGARSVKDIVAMLVNANVGTVEGVDIQGVAQRPVPHYSLGMDCRYH